MSSSQVIPQLEESRAETTESEMARENARLVYLNMNLMREVAELRRQLTNLREVVGFD
jgi:hypothetical protein